MKLLSRIIFCIILFLNSAYILSQNTRPPVNFENYGLKLIHPNRDVPLDSVVRYDFTLTMHDGTVLDCSKFIPVAIPPIRGWPTLIVCHGFGSSKEAFTGYCQAQAQYGYYTMTYSMRGHGNSTGNSNFISTVEMQDLMQIITYVKKDGINGSNANDILIMGGSQGGIIPFMAACSGARVKAIISSLATPDFASSWIENGSVKMTLLWSLSYPASIVRYAPSVSRYLDWIYNNDSQGWDSLSYWLPQGRDFMNIVNNCTVPVLMEGSWQDKFFNASGIIEASQLLSVPNEMYLGAVQGHGGDTSYTENIWHMSFFNDWFKRWLFSSLLNPPDTPAYQYASTTYPYLGNVWTFVHSESRVWPINNISSLKFYFNRNNKLTVTPDDVPGDTVVLQNSVTGGLTMHDAVDDAFTGTDFTSRFSKSTLVFDSDPLGDKIEWLGTPYIKMRYSSTGSPFCQFNYQIYDVKPDGSSRFINRLNYTDRNNTANTNRVAVFNGQAHSHIFQQGDRIRIILTNLDNSAGDSAYLSTNPFVLPVLINEDNTLYLDSNSYIVFPAVVPLPQMPLVSRGNENTKYELNPNYPNPFNPSTTIAYRLPVSSHVVLKIYDITGRLVSTPVDRNQDAGVHSIIFNGSNLASGIYFYRITAGEFADVKRMVLIK